MELESNLVARQEAGRALSLFRADATVVPMIIEAGIKVRSHSTASALAHVVTRAQPLAQRAFEAAVGTDVGRWVVNVFPVRTVLTPPAPWSFEHAVLRLAGAVVATIIWKRDAEFRI